MGREPTPEEVEEYLETFYESNPNKLNPLDPFGFTTGPPSEPYTVEQARAEI